MIKNDKQYQVTKNRLKEFNESLSQLQIDESNVVDPLFKKIQEEALKSQILQFEKELEEYEQLKKGKINYVLIDSFENIHEALIKARISKGWTHAELARRLDLKEQQIQRYELCNYSTASFGRINQVAAALELDFKPIAFKLSEPNFFVPEGFDQEKITYAQKKLKQNRCLLNF